MKAAGAAPAPSPPQEAPASLLLPADIRGQLLRCCRAALPMEACGVFAGRQAAAGWHTEASWCLRSIRPGRTFFAISAEDLDAARSRAAEAGYAWTGIFHSHPKGLARPSFADVRGAPAHSPLCLIVSLLGAAPQFGCVWVAAGKATPVPICK